MKKIIKELRIENEEKVVQVTVADERWYVKETEEDREFVPSVTWIASYYPKGIGFMKWLASKGWDEAEAIKNAAGNKGSKVHYAITDLIAGETVSMEDKYYDESTGQDEELTLEEYECLMSFVGFCNKYQPQFIANEFVIFGDGYAGTVDLLCKIKDKFYIVDFKTSQYIWPSAELQVSAYRKALIGKKYVINEEEIELTEDNLQSAILQVGYNRNKAKFKVTEISDKYELFQAARVIWNEECSKVEPLVKDYPTELSLVREEEHEA